MFRLFCVLNLALSAIAAGAQTNQEFHAARGVVIEVAPAEKTITIKHEEIPGYMHGMTMPFDVKDTNELAGLAPGDPVSFRIVISGNEGWIDQLHRIGARTNLPPVTAPVRTVRPVEPLNEGDLLPDYHFTNQLGQAVSTSQFRGRAVAITFLFTRCPFPNFCPLMANNFSETQKKLLVMPNAPANWHLLTITFDPEFDTPEVLKQYAEAHGDDDPARWTFATGALPEIAAIGGQFGLAFWKEQTGIISHNLRTVIIDPSGRVQKIFTGNDWQPDDLVAEIVKAAKVRR
ncbi:MAG TPA: SCO family protein [Verrucomicrobiae bacterium]|jgi:protein SCO1/2|nr:SCO family protein [Verrucomicrobiae bacterium]